MSQILRAIIVDDEELARSILKEYLRAHPDIEVVAECANGFEAVKSVEELEPDILFLDIQMPKLNGFEVLDLIDRELAVIFVTAFDEYALKAFEIHAVDYLLKPLSEGRFGSALVHAKERIAQGRTARPQGLLEESLSRDTPVDRVLIRDGSRVEIVPIERIDYLEAQDDYVCVVADGRKRLKQTTLDYLESILDKNRFVRVHRSFIVNVDRLSKLELYAKDSRVAILKDGTRIHVSRSGYGRLRELL